MGSLFLVSVFPSLYKIEKRLSMTPEIPFLVFSLKGITFSLIFSDFIFLNIELLTKLLSASYITSCLHIGPEFKFF